VPLERGGESRKRIGEALGAAVLSVLDFIPASPVNSIRVLSKPLRVPLKPIPSVEEAEHALDRARRRPEEKAADPAESELIRLRHDLALARKFGRAGEYVGEIQALALGDIMVVGLPGEVFCEITLAIRKARPAGRVLLVSLANDCPAYFPDDKAYDQGGYEPEWTPVARGAEALLVEAGRQIVEESLRQETPLRNAAGEHGREP